MLTETMARSKPLSKPLRRSRRTQGSRAPSESAPAFDRDYWLRHCEGFRVEAADGAIGFVDEVDIDSSPCVQLHVRAGLLGKRVLVVPTGNVAFIVPRAKKLWLASPVQIVESRLACS
jgi:hypothetical protein